MWSQKRHILVACFVSSLCTKAVGAVCKDMIKYTECTLAASLVTANCNQQVTGSQLNLAYYDCLCNGNNQLIQCYSLCPDDTNLQLNYQFSLQNKDGSCKAADAMRMAVASSIVPSSSISQPTSTGSVIASSTATLPYSSPVDRNTSSAGSRATSKPSNTAIVIANSPAETGTTNFTSASPPNPFFGASQARRSTEQNLSFIGLQVLVFIAFLAFM